MPPPSFQFSPFQHHLHVYDALLLGSCVDDSDHVVPYEEATLPDRRLELVAAGCAMDLMQHIHQKHNFYNVGLAYQCWLHLEGRRSDAGCHF